MEEVFQHWSLEDHPIVNPQKIEEDGTELDHSTLPDSILRNEFLASHELEEGQHTAYYSASTGKQTPERIDWYALRELLFTKPVVEVTEVPEDASDSPTFKIEIDETDELEDEGDRPSSTKDTRRLLHVRHLNTNFPLSMKKKKGGAWQNMDFRFPAIECIDEVLDRLAELKVEEKPISLDSPFGLASGQYLKTYSKYPVTNPLGWISRTKGGRHVFLLHPQLIDDTEMNDYAAYGLIFDEKAMRDVDRPQFRETWFNSLALLVETPGCPLDVEIKVTLSFHKGNETKIRVGQLTCWTLSFDTELKVYGRMDALVHQPRLSPALSEHLRRVLHVFLPSSNRLTDEPRGDITLQEFYDVLRPAPTPSNDVLRLTQPASMVAQLKPFQQRAVAWLLQNENATDIHPYFERRPVNDPAGLWEIVQIGMKDEAGPLDVIFCRLTGAVRAMTKELEKVQRDRAKGKGKETEEAPESDWLSPQDSLLQIANVRGSLLAEEMGTSM
jgi:hypothetical protein